MCEEKEKIKENMRILFPWFLVQKTTAPRIPAWSPTVVLTGRHSG